MAHQHSGQIRDDMTEAIIGNVGILTSFEVGDHDARQLAPYFTPEVSVDDLLHLGLHRAAMKTRHNGKPVPAFLMNTLPPPKATQNYTERLRQHTYKRLHMASEPEER